MCNWTSTKRSLLRRQCILFLNIHEHAVVIGMERRFCKHVMNFMKNRVNILTIAFICNPWTWGRFKKELNVINGKTLSCLTMIAGRTQPSSFPAVICSRESESSIRESRFSRRDFRAFIYFLKFTYLQWPPQIINLADKVLYYIDHCFVSWKILNLK